MTSKLSDKKLAVLGTGKLGGILLRAYLKQGLFPPKNVTSTVRHEEKAATLAKELGVIVSTNNRNAVKEADIVLLAVKPQVVGDVLKEIKPALGKDTLVISVAASVPTSYIEQRVGEKVPVVRAMPNTCSTVGCGMTGICRGSHASAEHLEIAKAMFSAAQLSWTRRTWTRSLDYPPAAPPSPTSSWNRSPKRGSRWGCLATWPRCSLRRL
jgi:pyrroline-5-carboxylate reductase